MVPAEADLQAGLLVVIDQIRASTTLTTLLDLGCPQVYRAGTVAEARRLAARTRGLLAGEYHARKPEGFDFDNSPSELRRGAARLRERSVVLCTANGTAVLTAVRAASRVLIGCLRNARACARAAISTAAAVDTAPLSRRVEPQPALPATPHVQLVCAGRQGRFALEDAIAAGVIAGRIVEAARASGRAVSLTDGAEAALRLRASQPDLLQAMAGSMGGRTLREIGHLEDIELCAREDETGTVPVLRAGPPMLVERLPARAGR